MTKETKRAFERYFNRINGAMSELELLVEAQDDEVLMEMFIQMGNGVFGPMRRIRERFGIDYE